MPATDPSDIGRYFLTQLDNHISSNLETLTGHDVWRIYSDFWHLLKEFKGNANGFTGLSEYLLFRYVYYMLGGSFTRQPCPGSKDLWQFVSKADESLIIGQSMRLVVEGRRYYPDIAAFHHGRLVAVCSIKIYLSEGWNSVKSEIIKLEDMRSRYPEIRALLVIFSTLSKRGTLYPQLKRVADDNEWFSFVILKENAQPLHRVVCDGLGLNRVAPRFVSDRVRVAGDFDGDVGCSATPLAHADTDTSG